MSPSQASEEPINRSAKTAFAAKGRGLRVVLTVGVLACAAVAATILLKKAPVAAMAKTPVHGSLINPDPAPSTSAALSNAGPATAMATPAFSGPSGKASDPVPVMQNGYLQVGFDKL